MSGINRVTLIGRMGADAEMRSLPSGDAVANFNLATSETWKDKAGQKQERTEWHKICVFGKLAEIVGQYTRKGSQIYIEGKLRTRKYTDTSGTDKYSTEIVVDMGGKIQLLDSKQDSQPEARQQSAQQSGEATAPNGAYVDPYDGSFDDDIPF